MAKKIEISKKEVSTIQSIPVESSAYISASREINDCWNHIGVRGDMSCPELEKHIHCRNCPTYSAGAAMLLEGELPPGYTQDWTTHYVQEQQQEQLDTQSVVVFRVGDELLGLPTSAFWEVVEMRAIHSLPHRQADVLRGLVNVRGELLMCVSLGNLLGIRDSDEKKIETAAKRDRQVAYTRLIVIKNESGRMVFPSSEVFGIYRYHPSKLQVVPSTVVGASATYTKAMLPWEDKIMGVLDDQLLFYALNRSLE